MSSGGLQISNSVITNGEIGIVTVQSASVVVTEVTFTQLASAAYISGQSSATIIKSVFSNNENLGSQQAGQGACVSVIGSDVTILESQFIGNKAGSGTAIYFYYGKLTVVGSLFSDNSGATTGGAMVISALHLSDVLLKDSTFINNTVTEAGGGALEITRKSRTVISNCTFIGNKAGTQGGAIEGFGSEQPIVILNSTFEYNSAPDAAVINIRVASSNLTIKSSSFRYNKGEKQGAIALVGVNCVVESSTFLANTATEGAAIFMRSNASIEISDSQFISNTAVSLGGAISSLKNTNPTNRITNSLFDGNSASTGAAIYVDGSIMDISGIVIRNCHAGNSGGGIFVNDATSTLSLNSSILENNSAKNGGGLYFNSRFGLGKLYNVTFTNNTATTTDGGGFFGNGGSINTEVILESCRFVALQY